MTTSPGKPENAESGDWHEKSAKAKLTGNGRRRKEGRRNCRQPPKGPPFKVYAERPRLVLGFRSLAYLYVSEIFKELYF